MKISNFRKASFVLRLVTVLGFTLLFIFTTLVLLDNKEVQKVFPHSAMRSLAIFCGYSVAIMSTNYFMALRGRNLVDWKSEILIAANFIIFFAVCTLPFLFPVIRESQEHAWKIWEKTVYTEANPVFYWIIIFQIPLLFFTAVKVKKILHCVKIDE